MERIRKPVPVILHISTQPIIVPPTNMAGLTTDTTNAPSVSLSRFWYGAPLAGFLEANPATVLGQLTSNYEFNLVPTQRDAWLAQIELLRAELNGLTGSVFFEFNIPRMGRRIDVVLTIGPVVFVIEFKVGEKVFDRAAIDQVWDYALDLKNFHEASHASSIVPILVATQVAAPPPLHLTADADEVYRPLLVTPANFRAALDLALERIGGTVLDSQSWSRAPYHPTPTIVEAARALYAQHSVEAMVRCVRFYWPRRRTKESSATLARKVASSSHFLALAEQAVGAQQLFPGLIVLIRRRSRQAECARLLQLLRQAGETGLSNNINFA